MPRAAAAVPLCRTRASWTQDTTTTTTTAATVATAATAASPTPPPPGRGAGRTGPGSSTAASLAAGRAGFRRRARARARRLVRARGGVGRASLWPGRFRLVARRGALGPMRGAGRPVRRRSDPGGPSVPSVSRLGGKEKVQTEDTSSAVEHKTQAQVAGGVAAGL